MAAELGTAQPQLVFVFVDVIVFVADLGLIEFGKKETVIAEILLLS